MTKKNPFHVHHLTPRAFRNTALWAIIVAMLIVTAAAALARSAKNFKAALTDKPDVAVYLLVPKQQELGQTTLLRETDLERDYLGQTKEGPKVITLRKGKSEWYLANEEPLHE